MAVERRDYRCASSVSVAVQVWVLREIERSIARVEAVKINKVARKRQNDVKASIMRCAGVETSRGSGG